MLIVFGLVAALVIIGAGTVVMFLVDRWFAFCDWRVTRRYRNFWRTGNLPRADIRAAQKRWRR